jgi:hypothetical protein
MFDFLDSDWFIIGMEIIFLILMVYDIKRYIETKKREYIVNIVLTVGFAIWTLEPYYKSYFEWTPLQKEQLLEQRCEKSKDVKLCHCLTKDIYQEYGHDEFLQLDKNTTEYKEFLTDSKEDCLDDSWF